MTIKRKYFQPSKIQKYFSICRRDIGFKLAFLRQVKENPENYTSGYVENLKNGLGLSIHWYHKMLRDHPELAGAEQLDLFKETSNGNNH